VSVALQFQAENTTMASQNPMVEVEVALNDADSAYGDETYVLLFLAAAALGSKNPSFENSVLNAFPA
jgi:hypothetical protein